jgi:CHAD domain-containing protein
MGYAFELDRSLRDNIRRIVTETVDESIAMLGDPGLDAETCIHEVRKNCKKTRAVLRFAAPGNNGRSKVTARVMRDVARTLSDLREAHILLPTLESLASERDSAAERIGHPEIGASLRTAIDAAVERSGGVAKVLDAVRRHLVDERMQLGDEWETDVVLPDAGVVLIGDHGRAVRAAREAVEGASEDRLHDWRKRSKTHWYHLRLVDLLLTEEEKAYRERVYEMTELLGRERDLHTLSGALDAWCGGRSRTRRLQDRISAERRDLRVRARALAESLESSNVNAIAERLRGIS